METTWLEEEPGFQSNSLKAVEILLVTANVGSLFEDPTRLLKPWMKEFVQKICQLKPDFIALHLQEVGGKTYEKSMEYVEEFIRNLCEIKDLSEYSCTQIYMDEDYRCAENFTALGNLYFSHQTLLQVKIWNFFNQSWEGVLGKNIFSGNIESVPTKEKSKFPQYFFPECKWSRKGFMRTRWNLNGTVLDLVNIHLFHDASNLAACEEYPSVYCKTRRRALVYTLKRFYLDTKNGLVPFFVFGDFNFRCDSEGVIKELTKDLTAHRVHNLKHDSTKVHYRSSDGNNVLTVGKKEFVHADHQLKFKETWLKNFDRELEPLRDILFEYPIEFPPTYPYEENPELPTDYMSTRCPAWCDRILMSISAKDIIENEVEIKSENEKNFYNIIGENVCMGDHKPIYLHLKLKPNQGTYKSCSCHFIHAKANKSTSHIEFASTEVKKRKDLHYHCPNCIKIYNEILIECSKLNNFEVICNNMQSKDQIAQSGNELINESPSPNTKYQLSQRKCNVLNQNLSNNPIVSINIFDSDNINICMCSRMSTIALDKDVDLFCQECHNKIMCHPHDFSCALIPKQLGLPNNIIVNRMDSQYLNTHLDNSQERDPYTPESAESHSPYPELNSASSSPSFSQSTVEDKKQTNKDQPEQISSLKTINFPQDSSLTKMQSSNIDAIDANELRRGIVSPVQLKSRLENLQKSSHHSLNNANSGDVDNVDKICQTLSSFKKEKCSCLPGCCNIC